ncbi:hypothetical protein [Asticcacaulis sp. AC402]|nr:hypothetical protein [Asticcacaulis sp. AC402]ESQ74446.1 hypothetical protein ABAC402_14100 [Asticcacaulis sp. AC402]
MAGDIALYISKRSQRWLAALLFLSLAQGLVASCTPEPVSPMAARVAVRH